MKVRLLEAFRSKDPEQAAALASQLNDDRRSRGFANLAAAFPPLLADKGLAAALDAQGRKAAIPVDVQQDGIGRYPQDTEGAIYFCSLEALQNIAKYADASRATVRLANGADVVSFEVEDDGRGCEPQATGYETDCGALAEPDRGARGIARRPVLAGERHDNRGIAPSFGGDAVTRPTAARYITWG